MMKIKLPVPKGKIVDPSKFGGQPAPAMLTAAKKVQPVANVVLGTEDGHGGGKLKVTADALMKIVDDLIKAEPYSHDGHQWAARPQAYYAKALGRSTETIWRWTNKQPFVARKVNVHGKTWTLLRIGEPDPKSIVHVARTLALIFVDHMKFLESQGMLNKPAVVMAGQPAKKQMKAFDKVGPDD